MNLTAGTPLQNGKYLINHVLGDSGLDLTLQGTQVQLNRPVILKTLKPDIQANSHFAVVKQRFTQQASRVARCQHPGLARVVDAFEENGFPFAVMDYTLGQSLADSVQSHAPFPEDQALYYIQLVGAALGIVHQQGLTHLDVTPRNMICPQGSNVVVLVNFALAHPAVLGISDGVMQPPAGEYAAIEQYHPHLALTPATDVYSLAATLYYLLTGHAPVAAPQRQTSPFVLPRQFAPHLSAATEAAILSGLESNSKSRPQTIAAWLSQLPQTETLSRFPISLKAVQAKPAMEAKPVELGASASPPPASPPPVPAAVAHPKKQHLTQNLASQNGKSSRPVVATAAAKTVVAAPIHQQASASQSTKRFSRAVLAAAAIAAATGLGLGLVLRFAAGSTGPGSSLFHTEQAFPPMPNWPGEASPKSSPITSSTPVPQPVEPKPPVRVVMPTSPPVPKPSPTPAAPPVEASPMPSVKPSELANPAPAANSGTATQPSNPEPPLPSPASVEPPPPPTSSGPRVDTSKQ